MALQQDRLEELRQGGTIAAPATRSRSLSSSGARGHDGRNGSGQLAAPAGFPDSLPLKREGSRGHIRKAPPVLPVPDSLPITIPQGLKKLLHSPPTGRSSSSSRLESPRVRNEEEPQRIEGEELETGEKKKRSRKRDKVKSALGLSSSKKHTAEKEEEVQATEIEPSVSQARPFSEGEDAAALQDRLFLNAIEDTREGIKRFAKSVEMMGRFLEQRKFDIEEEKTSLASNRPAPVGSSAQDIDLGLMVVENNRLANSVRARLQELQSIVDIQDHPGLKKSHQAVLNAVLTQFVHQIELYNRIQLEHRNRCRDRFARTATIVMPDVTEEQLEELLDTGAVKDVIYDRIMADQRQAEARKALFLMQEQRRDLRDLEKNLTDLQQLFLDVYSLLGTQEDTLRALNMELAEAKPRILDTLYELKDAEKAAKERRRWQRNMYATVAGVGLVMVAVTLAPLLALA